MEIPIAIILISVETTPEDPNLTIPVIVEEVTDDIETLTSNAALVETGVTEIIGVY